MVFGGIHATLFPNEPLELGGAHAVVKGDGDVIWASVVAATTVEESIRDWVQYHNPAKNPPLGHQPGYFGIYTRKPVG